MKRREGLDHEDWRHGTSLRDAIVHSITRAEWEKSG